ncbi:HSP70/90 co-chaperone [Gnomoniopsis sp. IMI 355080]|nr:HSP70/90 co-chaperone [Gnomoniopsis sp. IMI 355080]
MVHLEEINDKIETTLKVSEDTPTPNPAPAQTPSSQNAPSAPSKPIGPSLPPVPTPALPPQLAHNAGKSVDEILADLNKSPLFMTELDDDNNTDLEALQALAYEGTPLENATDFKASGNEAFREKRWADAREHYGRGVALITGEEKRRARGDPPHANDALGNDEAEVAAQRAVLEVLYVNRAACQLELGNHRQCWLDCAAALALNSRNVKAWYRSAKALLAVGRVAEADEACAGGLAVDANNGPLRAIARDIVARAEAEARKAAEEERRKLEGARRGVNLRKALEARGIKVRKSALPPDTGDARMELVEDGSGGEGTLTFPTVLLYPAHYESDFIKAFSEKENLMQHFGYVFPLPWDKAGEYSANGVECFMETVTGGLVKVGKKVSLLKVVSLDNVEVLDGVVKIYVIPKAKAEGWVAEFKAAKAKEKEKEGT